MSRKFRGARPGGSGGGGNMNNILKQAQKFQEELLKKQNDLKNTEFTGTAAGGMVTVVLSGDNSVKTIKLNPDIVDPDDIELLEDSIIAAFNDAQKKITEETEQNMGGIGQQLGGLNIPGLF
jgi:DNA-binding YbaB/EbfC family protein